MSQAANHTASAGGNHTCHDNSFGPWAGPTCRGGFDFTLLFEEAILTIPIQCLLLIALPPRIWQLCRTDAKAKSGVLRPLKAFSSMSLVSLDAILVGLWSATSNATIFHTKATLATSVLVMLASLGIYLVSWLEHERSLKPSFILFIYLLISSILDLARCRTLYMLGPYRTIPILFTITLALKIIMAVLETIEKRRLLFPQHKGRSPEVTRSTASGATFFWLRPLFFRGYKRVMSLDDLYPLDEKLRAAPLHRRLTIAWDHAKNRTAPRALLKTWLRTFPEVIMAPVPARLIQSALTYTQPFLIEKAVILAATPSEQRFNNYGYGLIGAFFLVYTCLALAVGQYAWRVRRIDAVFRGSVISLIYEKSLELDINSPGVTPTAAITIIGTDTETVIAGLTQMHDVWASLVEIAVGDFLVWRQLGAACAMPIAMAFVVLIGTIFVAIPTGAAQAAWIQAIADRISATSSTITSVKWLKVSGLTDMAFNTIRSLRDRELDVSLRYRVLISGSLVLLIFAPVWNPVLTFSVYFGVAANGGGDAFAPARAFTALSTIGLLTSPLVTIISALPTVFGALASFERIQAHLNAKKRHDNRLDQYVQGVNDPPSQDHDFMQKPSYHAYPSASYEYGPADQSTLTVANVDDNMLASVQGSFAWDEETGPVIDISNLYIQRQTLTMIHGPVGCGKSTLLKALLGELSAFEGSIRTNYSGVAFCDQNPWIPNETVRSIIVGKGDFDETWYYKVVKACALEQDIRAWHSGENTMAGTGGISFSGGQKQRLSIARAVYSRREFLIFDNAFSGLDAHTEDWVFTNLFSKGGILSSGNTTTVMTAADVRRASYANQIIFLTENGEIKEAGTPESLKQILGIFAAVADSDTGVSRSDTSGVKKTANVDGDSESVEEEVVDDTRRRGDAGMYKVYAFAAGPLVLTTFVLTMLAYAFCTSFPTVWVGWWSAAKQPTHNLGKWIGVYVALALGSLSFASLGIWQLLVIILRRTAVHFHDMLLTSVARAPMSFHAAVDGGITVNRFSQDLRLIDMELPISTFGAASAASALLAQLVIVSVTSKYLAAVIPVLGVIFWLIQHFYLRTSRQLRLLDIEHKAPLNTQLIELLQGLPTIRAYHWEDRILDRCRELLDDSQRPSYLLASVQCWLNFAVDICVMIIAVAFITITTTLRKQIGVKSMGTGLSSVLGFSTTAKSFITFWVMLEISLGAVARVKNFVDTTPAEDGIDDIPSFPGCDEWPSQGAIQLHNISASYPKSGRCLDDISLSIAPGERVAITGRTGGGKSSLTLCLLRLMALDSGAITIDGVDTTTLPPEWVRTKLVALPQEFYIFDGSIRLNLDPSETVPDEEIMLALDRVRLWNKVEARGGLDLEINDDMFSPGEAQLFVFARAMLRKSKVLILDEFTSSLDDDASAVVDEVLETWFHDWTILTVAHRLDAILHFDKVVVLDTGRVLEFDSPRRLLQQDSVFKQLYDVQLKGVQKHGRREDAEDGDSEAGDVDDISIQPEREQLERPPQYNAGLQSEFLSNLSRSIGFNYLDWIEYSRDVERADSTFTRHPTAVGRHATRIGRNATRIGGTTKAHRSVTKIGRHGTRIGRRAPSPDRRGSTVDHHPSAVMRHASSMRRRPSRRDVNAAPDPQFGSTHNRNSERTPERQRPRLQPQFSFMTHHVSRLGRHFTRIERDGGGVGRSQTNNVRYAGRHEPHQPDEHEMMPRYNRSGTGHLAP